MKRKILLLSILVSSLFFISCNYRGIETEKTPHEINVIFDTDMGNDIDDALALDMLYKYIDLGKLNLLAIMNNKDSEYSTLFIDIMNKWYGYPDIPIGKIRNGVRLDDYVNYAQDVCKLETNGIPMFNGSGNDNNKLPDSHILYRKVLAEQPDKSVIVISVGFSTNLARLLDTEADKYSPLSGKELVSKKVILLSVMGGCFKEKPRKEFNIVNDIPSAQKLFDQWPTKVVVSPFDVGAKIQFPGKVIENNFNWGYNHPLVEAYKHYRPLPYNRATWDLTSVLYVTEPDSVFFNESEEGKISVTKDGYTIFKPSEGGLHTILSVDSGQINRIKEYFIRLITKKPKILESI